MKPLLFAIASSVAFLLAPDARGDDLVLELTPKVGAPQTMTVESVTPANEEKQGLGFALPERFAPLPDRLTRSDKKYLLLTLNPLPYRKQPSYPAMLIAIPWQAIEEISADTKKGTKMFTGTSTVTCKGKDAAKFSGFIHTQVKGLVNDETREWPLASMRTVTVKDVTKLEDTEHKGPLAKVSVRFDCRLDNNAVISTNHSFKARGLGYRTMGKLDEITSKNFEMVVDKEKTSVHLSDFEKVSMTGTEKGPIMVAVQAPGEEKIVRALAIGEGAFPFGEIKSSALVFEADNGSFVVLRMRARVGGFPAPAGFTATIQATAGERIPDRLAQPPIEKKK